ncbi:ATP-binding protein [Plantactinospora sp. CA-290183]|uniref:ATP-binding protein n=1 Tax=Plantactinospora sp. CA-290183 TaxID=3240006 RepID=UPI003D9372F7
MDIGPFVGRDAELAQARLQLGRGRLLTLTGPGGVGKTRLALRVAIDLQASHDHGAWMIDLSAVQDPTGFTPDRLYAHMAYTLGIKHHGSTGLEVLLDHLNSRQVLLVLDGCEHLVPATRECVTALLGAAPDVRILATSRQALAIEGEHTLVVPPLSLPDAIALFVARATAAGAVIDRADRRDIADLCRRLDGLPLAIRLAAGRVRTLSVKQLLQRLDDRWRLLTSATRRAGTDTADRHSTLERVVDWSYELCTGAEQRLWARASVFARTFDLDAIESVCGGDGIDRTAVVDLVTGLVEKSVLAVDAGLSPPRYYLLETLRDYGLRKLAADEMRLVRRAHRDYYSDLVAQAAATWLGRAELDVMAAVHRELPDVMAAVDECVTEHDLPCAQAICRDLVRLRVPFLWGFLDLVGQQLRRVIDASDAEPVTSAEQATALSSTMAVAAWVAVAQGRHDTAETFLTAAHDLHRQWAVDITGPVLFAEGAREMLGGEAERAISLLAAARASFATPHAAGDEHMATMVWAMACAFAGDPAVATAASEEHLRQAQEAEASWAISWALWVSALAALRNGNHTRAIEQSARSLRLQRDVDDRWGQLWGIELLAWIIAAQLDHADNPHAEAKRAAWLLGAASARQKELGVALAGLRPLADRHARALLQIGAVLDEQTVTTTIEAGARGHAQAVRIALGEPTNRRPTAGADSLTNRERQVAALIAAGLTSAQIGDQLLISRRTVEAHVGNIMEKLGVHNRLAIAAWAAAHLDSQSATGPSNNK